MARMSRRDTSAEKDAFKQSGCGCGRGCRCGPVNGDPHLDFPTESTDAQIDGGYIDMDVDVFHADIWMIDADIWMWIRCR